MSNIYDGHVTVITIVFPPPLLPNIYIRGHVTVIAIVFSHRYCLIYIRGHVTVIAIVFPHRYCLIYIRGHVTVIADRIILKALFHLDVVFTVYYQISIPLKMNFICYYYYIQI